MVATGTAKTTGKTVGKAVLKSALKKIPFFGLFAGLAFAAGRAMDGDFAGAAAEALAGAAGSLPGLGTAASLAIDAGLLARDLAKQKGGATPVATSTIPPLRKPAEEAVAKMTQAETNAATVKLMQEMVDEQRKSRERMEKIQANTQSTAKSTKRSEPDQVTGNTVS